MSGERRHRGVGVWGRAVMALMVVAIPLSGCRLTAGSTDTSDIVIGASLELSGAYAGIGTTYQHALQLRIDQINAQGGVDGRQLRLTVINNKSDTTTATASVVDLLSRPGIAALILGYNSDVAKNSAKTVADKGVPTIALAPGEGVADPVAARAYTFKLGPNAVDTAQALIGYLTGTLHKNTVALLGSNDTAGNDQMTVLSNTLRDRVVTQVKFGTTVSEDGVRGSVATALEATPDALIVSALPEQAWAVARQARSQGFTGPILFNATAGGDLFNAASSVSAANGGRGTGIYLVGTQTLASDDVISVTPADAARRQWFSDYLSKYLDYSAYSSYAADAIDMIVNAIRSTGGTDHTRLHDAIENSQFDGITGLIRMTPGSHSGLSPSSLTILQADNDRWHLLA